MPKNKTWREAYPFFERENYPYKVWCDEVKKQIHAKTKKELHLFGD